MLASALGEVGLEVLVPVVELSSLVSVHVVISRHVARLLLGITFVLWGLPRMLGS